MGLGKTIQALVLVLGALTSGRAKRVLIVMPLSVMKNWENELMKWSDNGAMLENRGMGICIMHGAMNKKKNETRDQVSSPPASTIVLYCSLVSVVSLTVSNRRCSITKVGSASPRTATYPPS
jgi:SNF2 family DNA or RNA helicase